MIASAFDLFGPGWTALSARWWSWVLPLSVQVLLLLVLALVLERAFWRRARPTFLFALWSLVLLRLLVPPGVEGPLAQEAVLSPAGNALVVEARALGAPLATLACTLWIGGALACALVLMRRAQRLSVALDGERVPALERLLAAPVERAKSALGLRRTVRVEVGSSALGPLVHGVLKPRVVLPADFVRAESEAALEAALLHELAHVQRRDPLLDRFLVAVQILFWFHPASWIAGRRLRALAEAGADLRAARAFEGGTSAYLRALAGLARRALSAGSTSQIAHAWNLAGHGHELGARLAWLESAGGRWRARRAAEGLALTLFLVACMPLANPRSDVSRRLNELFGATPPVLDELEGCLQQRYLIFGLGGDAPGVTESEQLPSTNTTKETIR